MLKKTVVQVDKDANGFGARQVDSIERQGAEHTGSIMKFDERIGVLFQGLEGKRKRR